MSKIEKVVALSDLHLGSKESYLYSKNPNYQQNQNALITLLNQLGPPDELIINGDLMELSLAGFDEVYRDLKAFIGLLAKEKLYKRIVFIPGNHDHHFWRLLVEQVYVNGKISNGELPPGNYKYSCCFVNEQFPNDNGKLTCQTILSNLWDDNNKKKKKKNDSPKIFVKYPHHVISVNSGNGTVQNYLFTHGHFLEDLFKPINYFMEPHQLEELEAFNNIWLEVFDYHIGHAGRLSDRAREIEEKYQKGDKEAKLIINKTINSIYDNVNARLKLSWWKGFLIKFILRTIVKRIPLKRQCGLFQVPIDEKLTESITEYITKYIVQRYTDGKSNEFYFSCDEDIPTPFTFVFGHTHRPLKGKDLLEKKVKIQDEEYPLANTGGWLRTDGNGYGDNAGVLVIDKSGVRWETLEGKLE